MKKLILIYIFSLFIFWSVYANDCKSAILGADLKPIITKGITEDWTFKNILPKEAFKKAVENLQIFCCSQDSLKKDLNYCENDINTTKAVPESAYLFDHILDISMRRLDAKEVNENGDDLIYGLKPDPSGKEWRDFITKRWNNYRWNVPIEIKNEFIKHWTINKNNIITDKWDWKSKIPWNDETFKDYSNRTLWEKYNWICEVSSYMYLSKVPTANSTDVYKAYVNCKSLIAKREKNEYDYTNTILMQKWNQLLYLNVQSYLDNYFSQNKMVELQQIVFGIKTLFSEINRAIPELVRNCS